MNDVTITQIGIVPPKVVAQAANRLGQYLKGEIRAHKMACKQGISLEVGSGWRLLCRVHSSRKRADAWLLCSHERYNRLVKGTRS
ncbi:TPA: hypothetical protein I9Y37_001928 [Citrobacter freundii]|nr:hypothetical protein [Citrobacter freundii]HAT3963903.1 hypothetical protein [Citrobacter freundii]